MIISLTMFLSKVLTRLWTTKQYIVIETIFGVIACNHLVLRKYYKDMLMIALKLMASRLLKWLKRKVF